MMFNSNTVPTAEKGAMSGVISRGRWNTVGTHRNGVSHCQSVLERQKNKRGITDWQIQIMIW